MNSRYLIHIKICLTLLSAFIFIYVGSSAFSQENETPRPRAAAKAEIPRMPEDVRARVAQAIEPQRINIRETFADPFIVKEVLASAPAKGRTSGLRGLTERLGMPEPTVHLAPPSFNTRYEAWQREVRKAQSNNQSAPPVASAYLCSEIEPVGIVRGGTNPEVEALVFCKPEGRSFAAKIGTRFYDGLLKKITSDGMVFETLAGQVFVEWSQEKEPQSLPPAHKSNPKGGDEKASPSGSNAEPLEQAKEIVSNTDQSEKGIVAEQQPSPVSATASQRLTSNLNFETQPAAAPPMQVAHFINQRELKLFRPEADGAFGGGSHRTTNAWLLGNKFNGPGVLALKAAPSTITLLGKLRDEWKKQTNQQTQSAEVVSSAPKSAPPPRKSIAGTFCDMDFKGENYNLATTRKLQLIELFEDLYDRYKVNFIVDPEIQSLPVRLSIMNAPWTTIVHALMEVYDLQAVCMDAGIIKITSRSKTAKQEDDKRKSAQIVREVFRLKYIQPQATGRVNLAGQAQNGTGGNLQSLEDTIRSILRAGGDQRGDVRRVPGRSELIIAGTEEQIGEIRELIKRVDRPAYQVVIQALIYTVNDTLLKDIGTQSSLIVGNGSGSNLGGVSTLPNASSTSSGSTQTGVAGLNPGGIPGLGIGFSQPTNGLQAANPLAIIGATTIVGTVQFALQISAAERRGAANIQSRPFGAVADGSTIDLVAGSQIPVVTTAIGGGAVVQTGNVQFLEASRVLRITPQVAEDDNGNPTYVTLQVQLENNSVDTSLPAFGGLPALARQSLQTVIRLKDGQTGVIGGLAADSVSKTKSKVPGVGDVPIIGQLFKRTTDQVNHDKLYFAITATVIPLDAPVESAAMPSDANTKVPQPPAPQSSIKTIK